ncbi:hypothetical protein KM043_018677 [Ampulex compressa]|nr:hypothetical protein KM043_018677 [Ampulex compressa]
MRPKVGKRFCAEHQEEITNSCSEEYEEVKDRRIKCPLDPTQQFPPKFIVKGTNLEHNGETKVPKHIPLSKLDHSIVRAVIKKIDTAYDKLPCFPEEILQHKVLVDKINDESSGRAVKKHLLQNASLLAHLERVGLIKDNTCFIEFGAGKGKLAYWLGQMIKNKPDSCILLVDRSSHRHKSDNKLKNECLPFEIHRVRADIADLQLNNIAAIQKFCYKVGIAKHLCGVATDLTIRCLVRAMHNEPKCNVAGLIIAFCCHHRCEYTSYVGKQYLEECGFTPEEFTILCSIASWATCGSGLNTTAEIQNNQKGDTDTRASDQILTSTEREYIGRKVKTLLNWGRLQYLKNINFNCDLLYYTDTAVSLENMCIIATKETS